MEFQKWEKIKRDCLTSSISSRDTFLLSTLDAETEPESGTRDSSVFFGCSFWVSCETWLAVLISDGLCGSWKSSSFSRKLIKTVMLQRKCGAEQRMIINGKCLLYRTKGTLQL